MTTRIVFKGLFMLLCLSSALQARAQRKTLSINAQGIYAFSGNYSDPGTGKTELYRRVTAFFGADAMQANHWLTAGEENTDSLSVPIYIPLSPTADMRNQMVNATAKLYFRPGYVSMVIDRLTWNGQDAATKKTFHKSFRRLCEMPRPIQLRAMVETDNYLSDLSVKLSGAVAGVTEKPQQQNSGLSTVAR